jgi:phage baseplate assembly protein W
MVTPIRADKRTARPLLNILYSDIIFDFSRNPVTGFLGRVVNEAAISQMMKTMILTKNGEWPFEPNNGSATAAVLFDPNDQVTWDLVQATIEEAIQSLAPQVVLVNLQIIPNVSADSLLVTISYQLANLSPNTFHLQLVLRRVR